MHWVYVLKSSRTGALYVGETKRLFRRWNEHTSGRGGVNTSKDDYDTLVGLYNVGNNTSFIENRQSLIDNIYSWRIWYYWGGKENKGNACKVENQITEHLMFKHKDAIGKVKGGKYTTQERCIDFYYNYLEEDKYLNFIHQRPFCDCGYPCEVNMKKDNSKIYFNCPLSKPENWNDNGFFIGLNLEFKCDFYEEFEPYKKCKDLYDKNKSERCKKQSEWWVQKLPTDVDGCIKCNKEDFEPFWNPQNEYYSVCETCFHLYYEDLKNEYFNKPRDLSHIFS